MATVTSRRLMIGEQLLEVFPDNPGDPAADGVASLSSSLERVFSGGSRHWVGVQRYDVPDRYERGLFIYKAWAPVNTPVKDDGVTVAVLHHVEDITAVFSRADGDSVVAARWAQLRADAQALGSRFPRLPPEVVLGVLAHSHRVVVQAGVRNATQAKKLATLRLEALAGHPAIDPGSS